MSKLLIESLNIDLPGLAEMIRAKGRGKDTVLAHITPKEAALLKRRGGRGSINPETGLPEFEDEDFMGGYFSMDTGEQYTPQEVAESLPQYYPGGELPTESQATMYTPGGGAAYIPEQPDYSQFAYPAPSAPAAAPAAPRAGAGGAPEKPGFFDKLTASLTDPATLAKLGVLGGLGIYGAKQGTKASEQGQAAAREIGAMAVPVTARSQVAQQQYRDIAKDITAQTKINAQEFAALGAPQRELGLKLISQAQSGTLTPAGQRALAALKAQARQNISKRGGVGAMQAGVAESEATANLLEQQLRQGLTTYQQGAQYSAAGIQMEQQALAAANNMQVAAINTALQQSGIADQYTINAIQTGLAMDRGVAQSLQSLYSNLASVGFNQRPAQPTTT
jgi:hypothetical protein